MLNLFGLVTGFVIRAQGWGWGLDECDFFCYVVVLVFGRFFLENFGRILSLMRILWEYFCLVR